MTTPKSYCIRKDGSDWCAFDDNTFVNLQESDAAFGVTPSEAIEGLLSVESDRESRRRESLRTWDCGNCGASFQRATPKEKAACHRCKCGDQYVTEDTP